jgi:hypothetical protein
MSKSQPPPLITTKRVTNPDAIPPLKSQSSAGTPAWRRRLSSLARWLHIYLSMASFVLVLFFAVTGLTLNHADWFNEQSRTTEYRGKLPLVWVNPTDTARVPKLAIVEYFRNQHGIRGAVNDFRMDAHQYSVSFRGPGYTADAFIDHPAGTYQVTETRMGVVAVINDLHKGRDTGNTWSLVIDMTAVFMTLVSATGLVLLLFLKKRRVSGLLIAGLGFLACWLIYNFWIN